MRVLVINCGSSSAKYQLFDIEKEVSIAKGVLERIGQPEASLHHQRDAHTVDRPVNCPDHFVAIELITKVLTDPKDGVLSSIDEITGVGHRIVHGGEEFKESTLLTDEVIKSIRKFSELAPLHNPPSLLGIEACRKIMKDIPQVGVFDTSFHQTMPEEAFLYGLPIRYYKDLGVRKYGFHGTSHRFVAHAAAKVLKRPLSKLKLVTCHLGNGCSMAAVKYGKSIDTTMGFTPLEGLVMGTRSGDLDPAAVLYIIEKEKLTLGQMNDILNKKSGLAGISGLSNDFRDLNKDARSKTKTSKFSRLALSIFVYRIKKYIGAYFAAMGGLDAVIFTAGVGEHNPWIPESIKRDLSKVVPRKAKFLVVPTNEELLIARDTYGIIMGVKKGAK